MGVPSTFIRCSGCNLRCAWCDTPYTSWTPEGEEMPLDDIMRRVEAVGARHVVFTGGEPLIMPEAEALCSLLKQAGHHLTVETAATVFKPLAIDLASLSPKLANSTPDDPTWGPRHEFRRINVEVIQQFIDHSPAFQLKFVVSQATDLDEIEQLLKQMSGWQPADVMLMPEGTATPTLQERAPWLAELCKRYGYRYCPRLHVELYGHRRGV